MAYFEILSADPHCAARRGELRTSHGTIQTPAFMPVGTAGAVKGILPRQLREAGVQIVLANTYHLMLRPGVDAVRELGGLHALMGWDGPILTDSGGFQVFSLSTLTKVDDEGVEFASHIDGAKVVLNAEIAVDIQNRLGADIIMCFDQCTGYPAESAVLKIAVDRTIAWARRCKAAHRNGEQLLLGIVQGGVDPGLREYCAAKIVELGFDGYAIGGLSVGEGHERMIATVARTTPLLPESRPRYLMGAGTPVDIIAAVKEGIDLFDCVLPTRNGRNAFAFTAVGGIRLRNNAHSRSSEPIEADCDCACCRNFSRGALRHFFNSGEMLGPILVSLHNIRFYQRLMEQIRARLQAGDFSDWASQEIKSQNAM